MKEIQIEEEIILEAAQVAEKRQITTAKGKEAQLTRAEEGGNDLSPPAIDKPRESSGQESRDSLQRSASSNGSAKNSTSLKQQR